MANPNSEIAKLVNAMGNQPEEERKEEESTESPELIEDVPDEGDDNTSEHEQDAARIPKMDRRMSIATMRRASVLSTRLHCCGQSFWCGLIFPLHPRSSSDVDCGQLDLAVLGSSQQRRGHQPEHRDLPAVVRMYRRFVFYPVGRGYAATASPLRHPLFQGDARQEVSQRCRPKAWICILGQYLVLIPTPRLQFRRTHAVAYELL
jgi:hypothetical protein